MTGELLLALACEPAWERRVCSVRCHTWEPLSELGFGLAIINVWAEPESELFGNTTSSVLTVPWQALRRACSLARLAPPHQWVLALALGLLVLPAALMGIMHWLGDDASEWYVHAMRVVLITLAAFTVSVPVLHWVDRGTIAAIESGARFATARTAVTGGAGAVLSCRRCGRQFTVAAAAPGRER